MLNMQESECLRTERLESVTQTCIRQAAEGRRKVAVPGDGFPGVSA